MGPILLPNLQQPALKPCGDSFRPIGHTELELDEETVIGLYGPERSIIDAFRLRHLEGHELAVEALKRWLRRPGSSPAALLAMARDFPKARPALQTALEILL